MGSGKFRIKPEELSNIRIKHPMGLLSISSSDMRNKSIIIINRNRRATLRFPPDLLSGGLRRAGSDADFAVIV